MHFCNVKLIGAERFLKPISWNFISCWTKWWSYLISIQEFTVQYWTKMTAEQSKSIYPVASSLIWDISTEENSIKALCMKKTRPIRSRIFLIRRIGMFLVMINSNPTITSEKSLLLKTDVKTLEKTDVMWFINVCPFYPFIRSPQNRLCDTNQH